MLKYFNDIVLGKLSGMCIFANGPYPDNIIKNNMKKIRFGMIGGGFGAFIGDAHGRASRISNRFELKGGAFDADYEKGKAFGQSEGLDASRCYDNLDDFIQGELSLSKEERIEAVAIVTPNFLHFPYAKAFT